MKRLSLTVVVLGLALTTAAGAATRVDRVLPFATVTHGTVPWSLSGPANDAGGQVVNRVIDAPGQGDQVDFRRFFAVYVFVIRPTGGYDLTIRRLALQRFGGSSQICARVTLARPSGAVTQVKSMSAHYVKVRRGRLGFDLPDHIVVREARGAVVFATPGSRRAACKA
jgi:hypothetical protein